MNLATCNKCECPLDGCEVETSAVGYGSVRPDGYMTVVQTDETMDSVRCPECQEIIKINQWDWKTE